MGRMGLALTFWGRLGILPEVRGRYEVPEEPRPLFEEPPLEKLELPPLEREELGYLVLGFSRPLEPLPPLPLLPPPVGLVM
jgi:hypothetical protein